MRTLGLARLVSFSAALWGCSSSTTAPGSEAAGTAAIPSAGSGGSAAAGGSGSAGAASGAASAGGGAAGSLAAAGSTSASAGSTSASAGSSGAPGSAGSAGSTTASAGTGPAPDGSLGHGDYSGSGTSSEKLQTVTDIKRNGQSYVLITNGWGPGFQSHTISWKGTSFTVDKMEGKAGDGGQPAEYPAVFCGQYSVPEKGDCGLPKAISDMTSLRTGWRWASNGNDNGKYNASYDIWVGDATRFTGYLMVWLRDPPMYQPAGSQNQMYKGVTVANVEGTWDIWNGTVNNRPIVNWVRREGMDSHEIEFDVLDFVRDAEMRGLSIPGSTHIRAVATGFEIWDGPVAGLQSLDFYVKVN